MIPGFLGANIKGAIYPERRAAINGNWNELSKTVLQVGKTADEIFAGNRETARETGIPHVSDVNNESAKKILNS
ncbi:hypothetical protein [Desulfobacula phenolica]|uniref:Uncharacterized protein n=1 Tax=Desulfobacula phenolica TaxID=90732 RepID=A0A1H2DND2_9BACT|nr:hypothetical protein [Desulfobacula phenolica]SDT84410.1 hypothetical protein SAMN04487931_101230 [Desulfobacula phenolica]